MPQIHVRLLDRRWAVMRPDSANPLSSHDRRDDAVAAATAIADAEHAELVVFSIGDVRVTTPGVGSPPK